MNRNRRGAEARQQIVADTIVAIRCGICVQQLPYLAQRPQHASADPMHRCMPD